MSDMRLVNVVPIVNGWNDAAKKNLEEAKTLMASGNYHDYNVGVIKEGVANLISGLADALMKAPAVDPESLRPVAHWEVGGVNPADGVVGNWECSLCNETSPEDSSFCPCCGAKMEE